jgi:predicted house-cleaning NTP pyrophosphatase (Maf/HAM1 superfamily)
MAETSKIMPRAAPLILASASPRRLALLRQVGIEPQEVVPAEIDERPRRRELPRDYARRMAAAKAAAVADKRSQGFILAADTVVALGVLRALFLPPTRWWPWAGGFCPRLKIPP